jgi:uncharacterized membrane protein
MSFSPKYSNLPRFLPLLLSVWIFVSGLIIGAVTPPFQSPDEFEHITRAYSLTRGDIVFSAPAGQSSGGLIDSGLAMYMHAYSEIPFRPDRKVTTEQTRNADRIGWTGEYEFRPAPGMAYYFPGIYAIHALGLYAGESLQLSVSKTYHLTRVLLLIAISVILFFAFQLVTPSFMTVTLLILPMSLFQFASATLDGITTALAMLVVAIFLRSYRSSSRIEARYLWTALFIWLLLASSRQQIFPMCILLLAAGYKQKRYLLIFSVVAGAVAVIGWQALMINTVVDGRKALGATSSEIILFYLQNPIELFGVLARTLRDQDVLKGYFSSFIGLLGWLDTPFPGAEYKYFFLMMIPFIFASIDWRGWRTYRTERLLLVFSATCAMGIVFLAILVQWTPHPAVVIDGVVGRYLLVPALMISYAFSRMEKISDVAPTQAVAWAGVGMFGIISVVMTVDLLSGRYYQ